MAAIDTFISINITESATTAPTASTTIPLLLGTTNPGWETGDVVHAYTSAASLLTDGFTATSPEYLAAVQLTSQSFVPAEFMVGRRTDAAEPGQPEIDSIKVSTVTGSHVYQFSLNGKLYSYTSGAQDSAAIILQGLQSSVAADTAAVVTATLANNGTVLVLTGTQQGQALSFANVDSDLAQQTTQSASAPQAPALSTTDLTNIQAQNNSWYGLLLVGGTDADILTAASWCEGKRKFCFGASVSEGLGDGTVSNDLASQLKAANFTHTSTVFSTGSGLITKHISWAGDQLPQTPGTNNWDMTTLEGETPDALTDEQQLIAVGNPVAGVNGKNTNVYTPIATIGCMRFGQTASGDYIDNVIGIDWLYFNLQSAIVNMLISTPGKIPYTDAGMALIVAAVSKVLGIAASNGLIAPQSINVTAPKVSTATQQMRAARRAPTVSFTAQLQGAINAVVINGTVTI